MKKITENNNIIAEANHDRSIQIAGKLSILALKTVLGNAQTCFIPTVAAAPKDDTPKRPPPMKYKDLPLYDCPHSRYQEFENDKTSCVDRKIIHEFIAPTVKDYRKQVAGLLKDFKDGMSDTYNEVSTDYRKAEKIFLNKMRCPHNMGLRIATVTAGGLLGLRMGKTIPRRIFLSGLGLFITGSICFPEKTDEATRTFMYMLGKAFIPIYNFYFETDWAMRERVPCERDMPQIPYPPVKPLPACQPKK